MNSDIFGNLVDWGDVLDMLEGLKNSKELDNHQAGLARILRYPNNWRLREAALDVISEVETPTEELLKETLNIVMDNDIYDDVRIQAARTLSELVTRDRGAPGNLGGMKSVIQERMEDLLRTPHSPVFVEGIGRSIERIANS